GQHAAGEIFHLLEAGLAQEVHRLGAAHAGAAVGDDLAAGVEFMHALGKIAQRDEVASQVADLVLVRLAHIQNKQVFAAVQALFQFFNRHGRHTALHRLFFPADAAELVVVNELAHGGMRAAGGAVGILAQLELAEAHAQRVYQHQTPDKRLALAEDELDGFGGLHHADQSRQDAEHAPFCAGGNQPGRRRLRIQAAIARAFPGREDADLSLEAEDGAVDVGLAGKDAGVVDQVACGEVVGTVHDDVELAEELERVGAGEPRLEGAQLDIGVNGLDLLRGGIQLLAANVSGGVDDLALEVGEVHDVEVHHAQGAHASRGQVEGQRGAQASGADAQHLGGLELELALHADLGHDEVARVAEDLLVGQSYSFGLGGCGCHEIPIEQLNNREIEQLPSSSALMAPNVGAQLPNLTIFSITQCLLLPRS